MARFSNREEAGSQLTKKLSDYKNSNGVVLGLTRGGVVIASVLAKDLNLPLDFVVVKKIGAAENPELAVGAVTEDFDFDGTTSKYQKEARARSKLYRKVLARMNLRGKTAILVDDGMATGLSMLAAIKSAKARKASKIVVAVPVASTEGVESIKKEVEKVIVIEVDPMLSSVGEYYDYFPQVIDEEVLEILENAKNNTSNK